MHKVTRMQTQTGNFVSRHKIFFMVLDLILTASLKRLYWMITGPAVVIFVILLARLNWSGQAHNGAILQLPGIWQPFFSTVAAVTAIAGPVMIRVVFAHKVRQQPRVSKTLFLTFQRRLIIVSGITPYIALTAVCSGFSQVHAGGIILMAL